MKAIISFIKDLLFPNAGEKTSIGLSQLKYAKVSAEKIEKPRKQKSVSLTDLMRKT